MADHFDERSGVVKSRTPWGTWAQTIEEVFIEVDVPQGTRGKDVKCDIKAKSISCAVQGKEIFKVGGLFALLLIVMSIPLPLSIKFAVLLAQFSLAIG